MAVAHEIKYASIDSLQLDPKNPRLGRHNIEANLKQDKILEIMQGWTLDELAISFSESGFWVQEPLLVTKEKIGTKTGLVVIEGNRRLAALKMLKAAHDKEAGVSKKWKEIAAKMPPKIWKQLEDDIPYLEAPNRNDILAYLGFRHVTGIKEWAPAEKAEYIAHLIDEQKMSFLDVSRKIGNRAKTVQQHYFAFRILKQMEDEEDISIRHVEKKFSVLYLSLRTNGVQQYLSIDIHSDKISKRPVPAKHIKNLVNFSLWLFGNEKKEPIITDSRKVDKFGKILLNKEAVDYLERTENPKFETAYRLAEGDEAETKELINKAADCVEEALSTVHHHKKSTSVKTAVRRLGLDLAQLFVVFPEIKKDIFQD